MSLLTAIPPRSVLALEPGSSNTAISATALTIPIAVMIPALMIPAVRVVAAMIIAVPPAPSLSLL